MNQILAKLPKTMQDPVHIKYIGSVMQPGVTCRSASRMYLLHVAKPTTYAPNHGFVWQNANLIPLMAKGKRAYRKYLKLEQMLA